MEILVVISIIGLLSTIVLTAMNDARQKARVGQTRSQLHQIHNAFMLFNSKYGDIPPLPLHTDSFNMGWFFPISANEYLLWKTGATPEEGWNTVVDQLVADSLIGENIRYDQWGHIFVYDKNYNMGPYTCSTWSPVCSLGPDGILQTNNCQAGTPVTGGDDICIFVNNE